MNEVRPFVRRFMDRIDRILVPDNEFTQDPEHQPSMGEAYARSFDIYRSILPEAQSLVHGERQEFYGHPFDNFSAVAEYWTTHLGSRLKEPLTAEDVAIMKVLMKIARERHKPNRDNARDGAGYFDTLEMVKHERSLRARQ